MTRGKIDLIITGTGRCGTGYVAQLLSSAGFPCGHEAIFTWPGLDFAKAQLEAQPFLRGDASWLAAAHLDNDILSEAKVVHLVRHPQRVIESCLRANPGRTPPYLRYLEKHCPEVARYESVLDKAAARYIYWNELIEQATENRESLFYKIEYGITPLLSWMYDQQLLDESKVDESKLFSDTAYNHKAGPTKKAYLEDMSPELREPLLEICERYGYLWEEDKKPRFTPTVKRAPSVMIATPVAGSPSWAYVDSLMSLDISGIQIRMARVGAPGKPLPIAMARTLLVQELLTTDFEYILMVDLDAQLHPGTIKRLLSWDVPIIGALAFLKECPVMPAWDLLSKVDRESFDPNRVSVRHLFAIDRTREWLEAHPEMIVDEAAILSDRPSDALVKLDGGHVGAHCLLVHRDVFDQVPPPWFQGTNDLARFGTGEDVFFVRRVQERGFEAYIDLSVQAGHLNGETSIGARSFMAWDALTDWEKTVAVSGGVEWARK